MDYKYFIRWRNRKPFQTGWTFQQPNSMTSLIPRIKSAKVGSKSLAYLIRPGLEFRGDWIRCDTGVSGMSDSPCWMTPRSLIPKGGVTPPWGTVTPHQMSRYSVLQTHCDVLWSTCQGHVNRRQRWDYKMHQLTTGHYSPGEVWVSLMTSITVFRNNWMWRCSGAVMRNNELYWSGLRGWLGSEQMYDNQ